MITIHQPDDLISISLYNIFNYRKNDESFIELITDWNKKIVIHVEPFYPVTVIFQGNEISFQRGEVENPDMKMKLQLDVMLDLAYGREEPFDAINGGKLEMEGLGEDSSMIVRFYGIFMISMQQVAADPQLHYYEINKNSR